MVSINDIRINGKGLIVKLNHILPKIADVDTKKTVFNIFKLCARLVHYHNAFDYRQHLDRDMEVHDVFKFINVYGYGYCKQHTMLMGFLLDQLHIKNKILYLGEPDAQRLDHFAIEVFYDDNWHYFDPDLQVYFLSGDNIVSADAISKRNYNRIAGDLSPEKFLLCAPDFFISNAADFQNQYLNMFNNVEEFSVTIDDYPYKKKLTALKGIIKWYQYNEKEFYFSKLESVRVVHNGYGISMGRLIPSNNAIQFTNVQFSINHGHQVIEINDFPLLILDVHIRTSFHSNEFYLFINGKAYWISTNDKKTKLFSWIDETVYMRPIYSIKIRCNNIINNYDIISQKSNLSEFLM